MARLVFLTAVLAAALIGISCAESEEVKGLPVIVESNFPKELEKTALAYAQDLFDKSPTIQSAVQSLQVNLQLLDNSKKWSVTVNPAGYNVSRGYFAHYIVNKYHVLIYSVVCTPY